MTVLKTFSTCVLVLVIFVLCQYYLFVAHGPFSTFLNSLKMVSNPMRFPHEQDKESSDPLHVLILSYARTGSSFLGDLLQSYPNAFYHYEPLHFLDTTVQTSDFADGRHLLYKLFLCQTTQLPEYMKWNKRKKTLAKLRRNVRFWNSCMRAKSCYSPIYLEDYCSNHTVVIIKTIRMALKEAIKMYEEFPDLNLKIIYLVRDPRGILNSRLRRPVKNWCIKDPLCFFPRPFCKLLREDLKTVCSVLSRTEDFMVLRYEDLATNPYNTTDKLARFLGMESTEEMNYFVNTHTKVTIPRNKIVNGISYSYSTFRNSVLTAMKWKNELPYKAVETIQKECHHTIEDYGYRLYDSSEVLKTSELMDMNEDFEESVLRACHPY